MEKTLESWLSALGADKMIQLFEDMYPEAACFVVDEERTVLHWSEKAESMLGYTRDEAVGFHCRKVSRCTECMIGCPLSEQRVLREQPLTMYRADGSQVGLHKQACALWAEDGSFAGGVELLFPPSALEPTEEEPVLDLTTPLLIPTPPASASVSRLVDAPIVDAPLFVQPLPELPTDQLDREVGDEDEQRVLEPVFRPATLATEGDFERLGDMVTQDARMKDIFSTIKNIAETEATVLIQGESGTGKELVARAIHQIGVRSNGPFVAVNCAALAPSLLESELFGHVKGAFTGAIAKRIGLFQRAERGTVFLDEVAELPLELQAKLLRVLEEREVIPVGGAQPVKVDIRVLSASYKSLADKVKAGLFREDLMYRLRVVPIDLPPLRERRGDLSVLIWHLIDRFNTLGPRQVLSIDGAAWEALLQYRWPGNVRELKNSLEYAFAVGRGERLLPKELPREIFAKASKKRPGRTPAGRSTDDDRDEKQQIIDALEFSHGHIGQAAIELGMSRATLWRKRRKYGI